MEKLLKPSHVTFLSEKLDNLIAVENKLVESIDGLAAKVVLNYLTLILSPKIPQSYILEFHEAMDAVVKGDNSQAVDEAFDIIQSLVAELELKEGLKELVNSFLSMIEAVLVGLLKK